jgi:hypothetical protein
MACSLLQQRCWQRNLLNCCSAAAQTAALPATATGLTAAAAAPRAAASFSPAMPLAALQALPFAAAAASVWVTSLDWGGGSTTSPADAADKQTCHNVQEYLLSRHHHPTACMAGGSTTPPAHQMMTQALSNSS